MRVLNALVLVVFLFALAPPNARADVTAGETYAVDAKSSTVTFFLVHKLHKFHGVSKKVEGRARVMPTGQAQVMVRVPVESFDSENVNRDEHMKETVEAAKFPTVELKALVEGLTIPLTFPATIEKKVKGQVTFHGVTLPMEFPVRITFESATRVAATTTFNVSLEAFKIERPSLMFVKVDDELKIEANLAFTR